MERVEPLTLGVCKPLDVMAFKSDAAGVLGILKIMFCAFSQLRFIQSSLSTDVGFILKLRKLLKFCLKHI